MRAIKKTRLDPDRLRVESFVAGNAAADGGGTVRAHGGCTYFGTCLCQTAYYYCGDGYQTLYSCDYSRMEPCPTAAGAC